MAFPSKGLVLFVGTAAASMLLLKLWCHATTTKDQLLPQPTLEQVLEYCVKGDQERAVSALIAHPELVNTEDASGWNCLINASKAGHSKLVAALLAIGCSTARSSQHSALRGAALFGHLEVVTILLEAGHDVNALSLGRKTALMGAAMNGHKPVVDLLLRSKADMSIVNAYGETALSLAEAQGHRDVVELLQSSRMK
jgi:ankyrin repeat protein